MRKHTITQTDKAAYTLFTDALPYYWDTWSSLPDGLRFSLMINGYGSAAMACVDIVNHRIFSPELARDARKRLFHMQAWKGNEP